MERKLAQLFFVECEKIVCATRQLFPAALEREGISAAAAAPLSLQFGYEFWNSDRVWHANYSGIVLRISPIFRRKYYILHT
jgi:hypothetical protein